MLKPALDDKDKQIVDALRNDARLSAVELAEIAGLSKQVVGYRLKSLIERGAITRAYPIINLSHFGYSKWVLLLKYNSFNTAIRETVHKLLTEQDSVILFNECFGDYDVEIHAWSKDQPDDLVKLIHAKLPDVFLSVDLFQIYETKHANGVTSKHSQVSGRFDEKDLKILKTLSPDARISYAEIAKRVSLSSSSVAGRIRDMTDLLPACSVITEPKKYRGTVLVTLTPKDAAMLETHSKHNTHIVEVSRGVGPFSHMISLEVDDQRGFAAAVMELRDALGTHELKRLTILDSHKHEYIPMDVKEVLR